MPYAVLQNAGSIETCLVVKLVISPNETMMFSDYNKDLVVDGVTVKGLGVFLGITPTTSELRSSSSTLTITLSGIPNSNLTKFLDAKIKGNKVSVLRAFINPTTGQLLNLPGNFIGRFHGIVSNMSIGEDWDMTTRTSRSSIDIICSSMIDVIQNKYSGRRTNPSSQRLFYTTDASMDLVPNLVNAEFNFGGPA